jgi:hypothetical protein
MGIIFQNGKQQPKYIFKICGTTLKNRKSYQNLRLKYGS